MRVKTSYPTQKNHSKQPLLVTVSILKIEMMPESVRTTLTRWTVSFSDDRPDQDVLVPHAWQQDMPVFSEGPVTYRTTITVPRHPSKLLFHGVSYEAEVLINGAHVLTHQGLWDAFIVPLAGFEGQKVQVQVRVTKNGGPRFPVKEVASGFLPFVYHTFGGIYRAVELVEGDIDLEPLAEPTRVRVEDSKIFVDGKPFYARGLLTWGWYPNLGHTNADEFTIREEVRPAKALGFNMVKFCLWVPPHRYLDILREEQMEAWLELPLWDPSPDKDRQERIAQELERIVRQYRRHDNIIIWTVGCELSESTPPEYREYLHRMVKNLTGCPLVKDNSGGAEMYGGDLREFGDFYDFHPYCDTPFYPPVLDTLMPGPRAKTPILLGEFNDIDVHRDLPRLVREMPYWGSSLPELNDQGVRWQHDLPTILSTCRFGQEQDTAAHLTLMESSRRKALFIRKFVHEAVRQRDPIAGYSITGWRDTPISTAGMFDDWGNARFSSEETLPWNGPEVLFLIPTRRPPWQIGGNRPGFIDSYNHFAGMIFWRVGIHSERQLEAGLAWKIIRKDGTLVARGSGLTQHVNALESTEVCQIAWQCDEPGEYQLQVRFADATNEWPIWVLQKPDWKSMTEWSAIDPRGMAEDLTLGSGAKQVRIANPPPSLDGQGICILVDEETIRMPFWRECAYEFPNPSFWESVPFAEQWERLLPVSGDAVLDMNKLEAMFPDAKFEVLMNRVDTRTYAEAPIVARSGDWLFTTLRPFGGLGVQPTSLKANPAGCALLKALMTTVS